MNIPASTLEPFGVLGIPSLYHFDTQHDVVAVFGHTFLMYMRDSMEQCLKRNPEHFQSLVHKLMKHAARVGRRHGVTKPCITCEWMSDKYYFEYEINSRGHFQLMLTDESKVPPS